MTSPPQWDYGDHVRVIRNLRNDGTYPGEPTGTLLVPRGSLGYVKDVGTFLLDQLIYAVHFLDCNRIVGCREEELIDANEPWVATRFDFRDKVLTNRSLTIQGEVVVPVDMPGEILKVIRDNPEQIQYHVHFECLKGRVLLVPDTSLKPLESGKEGESPNES